MPYRDHDAERVRRLEAKLDAVLSDLRDLKRDVGRPVYRPDDAVWLALWSRSAMTVVALCALVLLVGHSCNHDENVTRVEVARANASVGVRASELCMDAGANP